MSNTIDFPLQAWGEAQALAIAESIFILDKQRRELFEDSAKASRLGLDTLPFGKGILYNIKRRKHFLGQMEGVSLRLKIARQESPAVEQMLKAVRKYKLKG